MRGQEGNRAALEDMLAYAERVRRHVPSRSSLEQELVRDAALSSWPPCLVLLGDAAVPDQGPGPVPTADGNLSATTLAFVKELWTAAASVTGRNDCTANTSGYPPISRRRECYRAVDALHFAGYLVPPQRAQRPGERVDGPRPRWPSSSCTLRNCHLPAHWHPASPTGERVMGRGAQGVSTRGRHRERASEVVSSSGRDRTFRRADCANASGASSLCVTLMDVPGAMESVVSVCRRRATWSAGGGRRAPQGWQRNPANSRGRGV